ncbi:MAG: ABC transporter ATP-binding protein [Candidatus Nanopelagicales bacterium]
MNSAQREFGVQDFGVQDLTVRFGDTIAINDVTLVVPRGHVTAVVGGDGAGKSTLLGTMVGLVAPEVGIVNAPPAKQLGYLPATAGCWAELTVGQNMGFVADVYGLADNGRIRELLDGAQLWDVRDRLARDLSGGMRKKLSFCMAVLPDPELIVLDEPSTGVDPVSRVELWRLITDSAAKGTAVVMATTYIDEAERAGWVLALDHGEALVAAAPQAAVEQMPGIVIDTPEPTFRALAWRRGRQYRQWLPPDSQGSAGSYAQSGSAPGSPGSPPVGQQATPDLETAVIVASLQARRNGRASSAAL